MKNIIISLLFLMPHLLFSQTDLKKEGLYYFQNQDYYNAVYFLEMAVDYDSTDSKLWYPLARSYTKTNQHKKSIHFYQKVWDLSLIHI